MSPQQQHDNIGVRFTPKKLSPSASLMISPSKRNSHLNSYIVDDYYDHLAPSSFSPPRPSVSRTPPDTAPATMKNKNRSRSLFSWQTEKDAALPPCGSPHHQQHQHLQAESGTEGGQFYFGGGIDEYQVVLEHKRKKASNRGRRERFYSIIDAQRIMSNKVFTESQIIECIEKLRRSIPLKNHKKNPFTSVVFRDCFTGKDAITVIKRDFDLPLRADAVNFAQLFLSKGYISPVEGVATTFKDSSSELYKFNNIRYLSRKKTLDSSPRRRPEGIGDVDKRQDLSAASDTSSTISSSDTTSSNADAEFATQKKRRNMLAELIEFFDPALNFRSTYQVPTNFSSSCMPYSDDFYSDNNNNSDSDSIRSGKDDTIPSCAKEILKHQRACKLFKQFSKKEFSSENIEFWEQAVAYKKIKNTADRIEAAEKLFRAFIAEDSLTPLNISLTVRDSIQAKYKSGAVDLFDESLIEVERLMEDIFYRFEESKEWKDFCTKELKKKKKNDHSRNPKNWRNFLGPDSTDNQDTIKIPITSYDDSALHISKSSGGIQSMGSTRRKSSAGEMRRRAASTACEQPPLSGAVVDHFVDGTYCGGANNSNSNSPRSPGSPSGAQVKRQRSRSRISNHVLKNDKFRFWSRFADSALVYSVMQDPQQRDVLKNFARANSNSEILIEFFEKVIAYSRLENAEQRTTAAKEIVARFFTNNNDADTKSATLNPSLYNNNDDATTAANNNNNNNSSSNSNGDNTASTNKIKLYAIISQAVRDEICAAVRQLPPSPPPAAAEEEEGSATTHNKIATTTTTTTTPVAVRPLAAAVPEASETLFNAAIVQVIPELEELFSKLKEECDEWKRLRPRRSAVRLNSAILPSPITTAAANDDIFANTAAATTAAALANAKLRERDAQIAALQAEVQELRAQLAKRKAAHEADNNKNQQIIAELRETIAQLSRERGVVVPNVGVGSRSSSNK